MKFALTAGQLLLPYRRVPARHDIIAKSRDRTDGRCDAYLASPSRRISTHRHLVSPTSSMQRIVSCAFDSHPTALHASPKILLPLPRWHDLRWLHERPA